MVRAVSLQTPTMGHRTYAELLRRYLSDERLQVRSVWMDQQRGCVVPRVVGLIGRPELPQSYIRNRNLDASLARKEVGYAIAARCTLRAALRVWPADVVHIHTQVGALALTRGFPCAPVVVSCDRTEAQIAAASPTPRAGYVPSIALGRRAFRAAAAVAPWSDWAGRSVIDDYGVPAERVHTIHPGVDLSRFRPLRHEDYGLARRPRLLFIGTDFVRKGGETLVEAVTSGALGDIELHLMTAPGVAVGVPGIVFVHEGVVAYSERWLRLLSQSDALALPTRDEPYGLAIVEALAAGLPVVAPARQAIPELVRSGRTGLLYPPGDDRGLRQALRSLLHDPARRRAMSNAAIADAGCRFDASARAAELRDLLLSTVADQPVLGRIDASR